jgi:signal transduction histidine kinase
MTEPNPAQDPAGNDRRVIPTSEPSLVEKLAVTARLDSLERALLEWAVHPEGVGFERAHLLLYDARTDELVAWSAAIAHRKDAAPLEEAVMRAAYVPAGGAPEDGAIRRRMRWTPDQLDGLAHLAWNGDGVALGTPDRLDADEALAREGAVRIVAGEHAHGVVVGGWDAEGDRADRRARLERFERFARRLLGAHLRHESTLTASRRSAAAAELARDLVSSLNVAELLHRSARLTAGVGDGACVALWIAGDDGALRLEVTHGSAASRERGARALAPLAAEVAAQSRARWIDAPEREALLPPSWAAEIAQLGVLPLTAYDRTLGVLAVWDRAGARPGPLAAWDGAARAYAGTVADLTAAALDQSLRFEELRRTERRATEIQRRLQRIERLADAGASAVEVARSARNPLVSITAFTRRAQAAAAEDASVREYLDIVLGEAQRLERLLGEELRSATAPPPPSLTLEHPNQIVQESLQQHAELLVRRRIRLVKKLSPDVPRLLLDGTRIREALTQILARALECAAVGGRMRVESRRTGAHVVLELAHDGPRAPGETLDQLFAALGESPTQGGGLETAHRIVREHGGELRVRSEGEWSAVVAMTLPVLENQDRRRSGVDRRAASRDRRSHIAD